MNQGVEPHSMLYFLVLLFAQSAAVILSVSDSTDVSMKKMVVWLLLASVISYLFMPAIDASSQWRRENIWKHPFLVFAPFSQAVWGIAACVLSLNERRIRLWLSRMNRNY
jgi:hypothetical protein